MSVHTHTHTHTHTHVSICKQLSNPYLYVHHRYTPFKHLKCSGRSLNPGELVGLWIAQPNFLKVPQLVGTTFSCYQGFVCSCLSSIWNNTGYTVNTQQGSRRSHQPAPALILRVWGSREGPFPFPESSDEQMLVGGHFTASHAFPTVAADTSANRTESVHVTFMDRWLGQMSFPQEECEKVLGGPLTDALNVTS